MNTNQKYATPFLNTGTSLANQRTITHGMHNTLPQWLSKSNHMSLQPTSGTYSLPKLYTVNQKNFKHTAYT